MPSIIQIFMNHKFTTVENVQNWVLKWFRIKCTLKIYVFPSGWFQWSWRCHREKDCSSHIQGKTHLNIWKGCLAKHIFKVKPSKHLIFYSYFHLDVSILHPLFKICEFTCPPDEIQGGFFKWPPLKTSKYKQVNLSKVRCI